MSEAKLPINQPDLNATVRDKVGGLMLSIWQQEAYIKALEEYVQKAESGKAADLVAGWDKKEEVAS